MVWKQKCNEIPCPDVAAPRARGVQDGTVRGMTRKQERTGLNLDEVSKAIIEQLQQDGRRSYAAIGKRLKISKGSAFNACK